MINKIKKIYAVFKANGLACLLRIVFKKIFPSNNPFLAWESRILFESIPGTAKMKNYSPNKYNVVKLRKDETKVLLGINGMTELSISNAEKQNENCWVVRDGNVIIAYVWISERKYKITSDTGYVLPINTICGGYWWRDLYVITEYRGKRLVELLFQAWLLQFDQPREETLYTEVSPTNIPSIRVHRRLGFQDFTELKMYCVLGFRLYLLQSVKGSSLRVTFYPHWLY